jgi:hypothetical protein
MTALTKRRVLLIAPVTFAVILTVTALFIYLPSASINYSMSGYAYTDRIWDYNRYAPFYTSTMPSTYYHMNNNTPLMLLSTGPTPEKQTYQFSWWFLQKTPT